MALGAFGLLLAVNKSFELVLALLANVLENRHGSVPPDQLPNSVAII